MPRKQRQSGAASGSFLPSQPYLFLFLVYLLALVFFAAFRFLFAYEFSSHLQSLPWGDICESFLVGIRFDQIVILFVLLPPVLILPWLNTRFRFVRLATQVYLSITFAALFLILLVDIRFFAYMNSHLNFMAVDYLNEGSIVWKMISADRQFLLMVLIWLATSAVFGYLIFRLWKHIREIPFRRSWKNQIGYFILSLALVFLGIRGRTDISPIDWGVAYYSRNEFLNQLALNGAYTLGKTILEEQHDPRLAYLPESERYPFVPFSEGIDTVRSILNQKEDKWLEPERSLLRVTHQPENSFGFRPNVVVVLMESWAAQFTGALGAPRNLTPHFDSLAAEGILFTNFYANGIRTNFGLPAVLCSFPSLPGRSVMKRYFARHPFRALSEILHERGYYNAFVYGGDLAFDNMQAFFIEKQYDGFFGEDYFGRENIFSKWGVPDHIVFEKTAPLLDSLPRPFQATILTISNHEPFDLPDSSLRRYFDASDSSRIFNSQIYADYAVGRFIELMKTLPVFDSTIFVFTADHARFELSRHRGDPNGFHIPLLIYAPRLLNAHGERKEIFGSQVDILPTVMSLLGGDYTHASWGRNLFIVPDDDPGFVPMNIYDYICSIDRDFLYLEPLGRSASFFETAAVESSPHDVKKDFPTAFNRRQRRLRSYMQIAEQLSTPMPEQR